MIERKTGLWLAATGVFAAATCWAFSPPETPLRTQLTGLDNQMGALSKTLHNEGALADRIVMAPYFLPATDVQVTDPYHPRMPELYDLMRERRQLSKSIVEDEGLTQTRLRQLGFLLEPILFFGSLVRLRYSFPGRLRFRGREIPI